MAGLPNGKKILDMFTRFDTVHDCDRQTDGQTDRHCTTAQAVLMHSTLQHKLGPRAAMHVWYSYHAIFPTLCVVDIRQIWR